MNIPENMTDEESIEFQLKEWVQGNNWHNTVRDECCPDFACCSDIRTPKEDRIAFSKLPREQQGAGVTGALGALVKSETGLDAYVVGGFNIK